MSAALSVQFIEGTDRIPKCIELIQVVIFPNTYERPLGIFPFKIRNFLNKTLSLKNS